MAAGIPVRNGSDRKAPDVNAYVSEHAEFLAFRTLLLAEAPMRTPVDGDTTLGALAVRWNRHLPTGAAEISGEQVAPEVATMSPSFRHREFDTETSAIQQQFEFHLLAWLDSMEVPKFALSGEERAVRRRMEECYEQLRAMRRACRRLGLTRDEIEDLFCNTALHLVESVRSDGA